MQENPSLSKKKEIPNKLIKKETEAEVPKIFSEGNREKVRRGIIKIPPPTPTKLEIIPVTRPTKAICKEEREVEKEVFFIGSLKKRKAIPNAKKAKRISSHLVDKRIAIKDPKRAPKKIPGRILRRNPQLTP